MVHKGTSSSYRSVDCNGFDLAWFSSLPSISVSSDFMMLYIIIMVIIFLFTFLSLFFSELSLVGLALDVVD